MDKYRLSFFMQLQHNEVTAPWNQQTHTGIWGECNCSTHCFCREQLQQHILTSAYLHCTHFHCNGIICLLVHCKDEVDVNSVCTVIISETVLNLPISVFFSLISFSSNVTFSVGDIFSSSLCVCCQWRLKKDINLAHYSGTTNIVSNICQLIWKM